MIGLVILLVLLDFQGYEEEGGFTGKPLHLGQNIDLQKKIWWVVNKAGGGGSRDNCQLAVNWDES